MNLIKSLSVIIFSKIDPIPAANRVWTLSWSKPSSPDPSIFLVSSFFDVWNIMKKLCQYNQVIFQYLKIYIIPINNTIIFIHHPQYRILIWRIQRCYWYISYSSELTAIVQMLVLQSEEIPNKTPKSLKTSIYW